MVYKSTYQPAQSRQNRRKLRGQKQSVRFALSSSSSDSCTTGCVYVDERVIGVLEHFDSSILLEIEHNTGCSIILPTWKASNTENEGEGDEATTVEIDLKGTAREISKAQDALYEFSQVVVQYTKALLPTLKDTPLNYPKDPELAYLRIASTSAGGNRHDNVMVKKETMQGLKELVGDTTYDEAPKEVVLYGEKEDIAKVREWIRDWDQKVVYRKERNEMKAR